MSLRQPEIKQANPNNAEIEKLAKLQGVKPFNFDEAVGKGSQLWKNSEFAEFKKWLKDVRISDTISETLK
jgi:hypothetical protein